MRDFGTDKLMSRVADLIMARPNRGIDGAAVLGHSAVAAADASLKEEGWAKLSPCSTVPSTVINGS